ncbi:hypothetical protein QBC45DRAFT_400955 [Copromyces sp. CBS 386.78]|nr:hypothetical protein QBC45DRAFT_400955 [Copromyces sp. CBS 386.78]
MASRGRRRLFFFFLSYFTWRTYNLASSPRTPNSTNMHKCVPFTRRNPEGQYTERNALGRQDGYSGSSLALVFLASLQPEEAEPHHREYWSMWGIVALYRSK